MKKKLYTILTVLLIVMVTTTPVLARGAISLGGAVGASWPLHLNGDLYGVGGYTQGVYVKLDGFGEITNVTCGTPGNDKLAPGQNGDIFVEGTQQIGSEQINKKGHAGVYVEADQIELSVDVCPNVNWVASYDIDWDHAIVRVFDTASNDLLLWQYYACEPDLNNPEPGHYTCSLEDEISYH